MARVGAWGEEYASIGGRQVYGPQDEKLGEVEVIYFDDTTGQAQWIGVRGDDFTRGRMLLPLTTARLQDTSLHVPYSRQQLTSAPDVGDADYIPPEVEEQLHVHYKVEPSKGRMVPLFRDGETDSGETDPHERGKVEPKARAYRDKAETQVPDYPEYASKTWYKDEGDGRGSGAHTAEAETRQDRAGIETQREPTLAEELRRGQEEAIGIGQEIAGIASDLQAIFKQEMQLAKAEMGQQLGISTRAIAWGAAAGICSLLMAAFLFTAVMFALALTFELWLSALITTGILGVLTIMAGLLAYQQVKKIKLVPQRTMESVKEDVEWARNQIK